MQMTITYVALWLAMIAGSLTADAYEAVRCVMYLTG